MKHTDISTYLELCAAFMGYVYSQHYENYNEYFDTWDIENSGVWYKKSNLTTKKDENNTYYVRVNGKYLNEYHYKLCYHNDWNWIFEIIEELETLSTTTIMGIKIKGNFIIERNRILFYFCPDNNFLLHLEVVSPHLLKKNYRHPLFKEHIIKGFDFKNGSRLQATVFAIKLFLEWYYEK